ncbi:MAG: type II secretion system protein [Armatimonadia bacterium]
MLICCDTTCYSNASLGRRHAVASKGFTLIELLVVIAII